MSTLWTTWLVDFPLSSLLIFLIGQFKQEYISFSQPIYWYSVQQHHICYSNWYNDQKNQKYATNWFWLHFNQFILREYCSLYHLIRQRMMKILPLASVVMILIFRVLSFVQSCLITFSLKLKPESETPDYKDLAIKGLVCNCML